jgi:putative membrane protein (TIGR04086 family)
MSDLDWGAIARGAGVGFLVALPAAIVQTVTGAGSLKSLAFLVTLVGFALGGYVAARPRPTQALTHGGLAGLVAGIGIAIVSIVRRSAAGEAISWLSYPLQTLLAVSSGLVGGYILFRRNAQQGAR